MFIFIPYFHYSFINLKIVLTKNKCHMKTKKFNKITKTILAELLVWSQKANGVPKQEIIDAIFTGLTRGYVKSKGEQVTEREYIDQGSDTRFLVDFAGKTIKVSQKDVQKAEYIFALEETEPKAAKAEKAPKAAKQKAEPKQKPVKEEKVTKRMEKQRNDVKEFLEKNFELEFNEAGKIKRFRLLDKENKQMAIDMVLGGVLLCVLKNVKALDYTEAESAIRFWMKNMRTEKAETAPAAEVTSETTPDVTAKSPSPKHGTATVAAKRKK